MAAYDPENPSTQAAGQIAAAIGKLLNMKYGREDELESDRWGVKLLTRAGYDPRELIKVMEVLDAATKNGRPPEFFSTHPNPENRVATIEAEIQRTIARASQ
jgi:predicted Zn-dependent protease